MNSFKILCLIVVIIMAQSARAQFWDKDYYLPVPSGDRVNLLCYDYSMAHGGLFCYSTMDSSADPLISDYYIVRINNTGDTLCTKFDYFDTLGYRAQVSSITQLSDGSYIIGTSLTETTDQWHNCMGKMFYRLDSTGTKTHAIQKGMDQTDAEDMKVMKTGDNGYYLSYSFDSIYYTTPSDGYAVAFSYIERYDSDNVLLWYKEFETSGGWAINPPYTDIYSAKTPDDGIMYFTRGKIGKVNADGSLAFEFADPGMIPQGGWLYQIFGTSDTGSVIIVYDSTAEKIFKFNSSGLVEHKLTLRLDSGYNFQLWAGAEIKKDVYLFVASLTPGWGFSRYDKDLNFLDSIPDPFRHPMTLDYPPVANGHGGGFCAFNVFDSGGYNPYTFAVNFDSAFNIHLDLKIAMHSNCLVPADSSSKLFVTFFNHGDKIVDTTAFVVLDSNTYYLSSSVAPIFISGDTLVYNIDSLNPGDSQKIVIYMKVDSTLGLGSVLTFYSYASYANNVNVSDDTVLYCGTTVSAIDPNSKMVNRQFYFTPDKGLIYTINFENTGNYYARSVTVLDTLDANLDPSSLKILGGNPIMPAVEWTSGNALRLAFADIYLPDSVTSPGENRGQIVYSVKTKTNAVLGDTIKNTAHIYFDYNPDVITNTTINVISDFDGQYIDSREITIFPNPTNGKFTLLLPQMNGEWSISILDVSGRTLTNTRYVTNYITMEVNLNNGMYLMEISNSVNKESFFRKLVIAR